MNVRSCTTHEDLRIISLLQLHTELARLEQLIEEDLSNRSDSADCLRRWETVNDPEHVRCFYEIDQSLRQRYALIARVCQEKERDEISELKREARQSAYGMGAVVLADVIPFEGAC